MISRLTHDKIGLHVRTAKYAVNGDLPLLADEIEKYLLEQPKNNKYNFDKVVKCPMEIRKQLVKNL